MNEEQIAERNKLVLKIDIIISQVKIFGKLNNKVSDVQSTIRCLNNASGSLRSVQ